MRLVNSAGLLSFLVPSLLLFPWQFRGALGLSGESQQIHDPNTCAANDTACTSNGATDAYSNGKYQRPAEIVETINTEYGEPQVILNIFSKETRRNVEETNRYITTHKSWRFTCQNHHYLCSYWAATQECSKNAAYMQLNCAPSCQVCQVPEENPQDAAQAALLNASVATNETAILVATAFGASQYVPTVNADPVVQIIAKATTSMVEVYSNETFAEVRNNCQNKHSKCSLWASEGECEKNPEYMTTMCAPSCFTCERIAYDYRCSFNKNAPTALQPRDLNKLFERVSEYSHLTPSVLSRPPIGPWILQLDTFATPEECDRLIYYGQKLGYGASVTVGRMQPDGTVEAVTGTAVRTSATAWCEGECENDPIVQSLLQRIDDLLEIPRNNSEFLQLLQYQKGQYYRKHHDYLDHHQHRPQGPRILTLFLYLNDEDMQGGETRFTNLNLDVKPRRGRAVLWPNVLNEDPNVKDFRTEHEALTVVKGVKFGANSWVHQRDYRTPHYGNCA